MANYLKTLRSRVGNDEIILNCAAAWIENENGILLERRGDDGKWGLIGGVMEIGESPAETVKREVKEETGVEAELGELIGVYTKDRHIYPNGDRAQLVVFFYNCLIDKTRDFVLSHESIELRYFEAQHLPELGMLQHQKMAQHALQRRRGFIET